MQYKVLFDMEESEKHLEHLAEIKAMMQRSSQFISLSGLSGVGAGVAALVGSFFAYRIFQGEAEPTWTANAQNVWTLTQIALGVFIGACILALYFTNKKVKRNGESLWNRTSKKVLFNLAIPMVAGGAFCLGLVEQGYYELLAPTSLLFYGLACVNGAHYTFSDIRYLGICLIALGIANLFWLPYGLFFWALGFGVLHILYGSRMYLKYDRVKS